VQDDLPDDWDLDAAQAYAHDLLGDERVRLRGVRPADIPDLVQWRSEAVAQVAQRDAIGAFDEDAAATRIRSFVTAPTGTDDRGFAVETAGHNEVKPQLLGLVTLSDIALQHRSAEFAISLAPNSGGQGFGLAATRLTLRYAFSELGLHRVWLRVWAFNGRALRTYERAGFRSEGRLREVVHHAGRWHDEIVMGCLSTDTI
jgi:RimJ/RimL family protein N-acetyltransferase